MWRKKSLAKLSTNAQHFDFKTRINNPYIYIWKCDEHFFFGNESLANISVSSMASWSQKKWIITFEMQYLQLSRFIEQFQYEKFVKQPWLNNRSTPKKQMTLMHNVVTKK
jgi:hypothetical protein